MIRLSNRQTFWLFAAGAFCIAFLARAERHLFGWFGPHEYWATHWARDYSGGFIRRGLLGQLVRTVGADDTSYALITVGSWIVLLCLFAVLTDALWRITQPFGRAKAIALLFAVLLSPATLGTLLETQGDPLQLILLIYILTARFLLPHGRLGIVVPAFAFLGIIMSLTHEASIFFVLPALGVQALLLRRTGVAWAAFGACLITSAIVVSMLLLTNIAEPPGTNPILHLGDATFVYEGTFDSFAGLLGEELTRMFGSGMSGLVETAARILGATLIPVFLAAVMTSLRFSFSLSPSQAYARTSAAFVLAAIAIAPMMLIAHDWGRFFAYLLIIFLASVADTTASDPDAPPEAGTAALLGGGLLLAGLTTTDLLSDYRMDGLYSQPRLMLACLLVCGLTAWSAFLLCRTRTLRT